MEDIKLQILKILSENSKKMWRKLITPPQQEYLDSIYNGYSTSIQCKLLYENKERPSCVVCDGALKLLRNTTCSTKCREIYMKNIGHDRMAIMKEKIIEQYGVENVMQYPEFVDKAKKSKIEKYRDVVSPRQKEISKQNAAKLNSVGRETMFKKYGVHNPSQIEGHYKKSKQTLLDRYGVEHPSKIQEIVDKKRIERIGRLTDILPNNITFIGLINPPELLQELYENPNDRIKFQCSIHNSIEEIPTETFKYRIREYGSPCGLCSDISTAYSHKEKEIYNFLKANTSFKIIENDRTLIHPYELDIVIPEKKVAIEFCGLYWHNDKRKDKKYHYDKLQMCRQIGYRLITIFEDEWDYKQEIVKQRLLYKLGVFDKTLWARKCIVKEISNKEAKEFNNKYHIQGHINSSIRYGLYYNEELVSLMMFSKPNISKGKNKGLELTRFATSCNVVGAAGKLFNYFIKKHNPETIFSFCDLRWNTGEVYNKIGMTLVGETPINYWYIKGNSRIHRFSLRKKKDEDKNISEKKLRDLQGWHRIWDCGNYKFVWNREAD